MIAIDEYFFAQIKLLGKLFPNSEIKWNMYAYIKTDSSLEQTSLF